MRERERRGKRERKKGRGIKDDKKGILTCKETENLNRERMCGGEIHAGTG